MNMQIVRVSAGLGLVKVGHGSRIDAVDSSISS